MLNTSPKTLNDMELGEDCSYILNTTKELKTKTISTYSFKIYNQSGVEVTDTLSGGSSNSGGLITFGIRALVAGQYSIGFIVTCNEVLPDGITPYKFYVSTSIKIQ